MLWLAPPVLFTLGLGISKPTNSLGFGYRPPSEPFLDVRGGYRYDTDLTIGLRARGSRLDLHLLDGDDTIHRFDGYTLELGAFGELDSGPFAAMLWFGIHTARMTYQTDAFFTGPVFAAGLTLGVHLYRSDHYRVTLFGEIQGSRTAALADGFDYQQKPLSVGVAVRF